MLKHILLLPDYRGKQGGPASFQKRFSSFLVSEEIDISYKIDNRIFDVIFVINGSRYFLKILYLHFLRKTRIVLRLGSRYRSNLHECKSILCSLRYFPRFIIQFFLLNFSDHVIFQSKRVCDEWSTFNFLNKNKHSIIYNSLDIELLEIGMKRVAKSKMLSGKIILSIETNHPQPSNSLALAVFKSIVLEDKDVRLVVLGNCSAEWLSDPFVQDYQSKIQFLGHVDFATAECLFTAQPILVNSDFFPAGCPNSIIDAFSMGIPSIGYKNSVFEEMISDSSGVAVESSAKKIFSGTIHNIDDFDTAAKLIWSNYPFFVDGAFHNRNRYNPDLIFDQYIRVLN